MQPITRSLPAVAAFIALCSIAFTQVSFAQVPTQISYQGQLDDGGTPVDDPSATLTFRLFDDGAAGTELWVETQIGIEIADGVFSVDLGSVTSLTPVNFSQPVWLSIAVGDAAAPQLSPRSALAAVPYARSMRGMRIEEIDEPQNLELVNVIGGSPANEVTEGAWGATISGGGLGTNINLAGPFATVGGGDGNSASGSSATIGGGSGNAATNDDATIGGGESNTASGWRSTIGGGLLNTVTIPGSYATIGGGTSNTAYGLTSTIGGRSANAAGVDGQSSGAYATIGGGKNNKAYGFGSSIGGGSSNVTGVEGQILGTHATIPGGSANEARANHSFAAGTRAIVRDVDTGSFVWADSDLSVAFQSTGTDQFLVRARGGVGIGTNTPIENLRVHDPLHSSAIFLGGDGTAGPHGIIFGDDVAGEGVQLFFRTLPNRLLIEKTSAGTGTDGTDAFYYDRDDDHFFFGGNIGVGATPTTDRLYVNGLARRQDNSAFWDTTSDIRLKKNVENLDGALGTLQQLRPVTFQYKDPELGKSQRMGFVAQEVNEVLPDWVNENAEGYLSINPAGFEALVVRALQELSEENRRLRDELEALRSEIAR